MASLPARRKSPIHRLRPCKHPRGSFGTKLKSRGPALWRGSGADVRPRLKIKVRRFSSSNPAECKSACDVIHTGIKIYHESGETKHSGLLKKGVAGTDRIGQGFCGEGFFVNISIQGNDLSTTDKTLRGLPQNERCVLTSPFENNLRWSIYNNRQPANALIQIFACQYGMCVLLFRNKNKECFAFCNSNPIASIKSNFARSLKV